MDSLSFHENRSFEGAHHPCSTASGEPCIPCINILKLEAQMKAEKGQPAASMIVQHREMKTKVNQNHDPISRLLPLEIISLVFEFSVSCLTSLDVDEEWIPDDFDHYSVLKLGAVCVAWRAVAWATPRLWTSIAVHLKASKFPSRATIAQEWLQRSGYLPLYIFLEVKNPSEDIPEESSSEPFSGLIDTINSLCDRWRVLHLELPLNILRRIRPTSATGLTPVLHTLRLAEDADSTPDDSVPILDAFAAPNIAPRAISIVKLCIQSIKIQWNQLSKVYAHVLSVNGLIELLANAPLLSTCLVDDVEPSESQSDPTLSSAASSDTHVHTSLTKLRFAAYSDGAIQFFDIFTLPALQHLAVWSGHEELPGILVSFIKRSQCSLEYLSISATDAYWEDLISLFHATKSLERLILRDCLAQTIFSHFEEHCCRSFCNLEKQDTFLPNLRRLSYRSFHSGENWKHLLRCLNKLIKDCDRHNSHPDFPKLNLSLYVDIEDSEELRSINPELIPHFVKILWRGVPLSIEGDILSGGKIIHRIDFIEESMYFHDFPEKDVNKYYTLMNRLELEEWEG